MKNKPKENPRLAIALDYTEKGRLARVDKKKSKRAGERGVYSRFLTQQEAIAFCGVSRPTLLKWKEKGLKTTPWGRGVRYRADDLLAFMQKKGYRK